MTVNAIERCQVSYPVVLTHHWGMKALCDSAPDEECDRIVSAKYCQQWVWDDVGQDQDCLHWRVPDNELDLPPRNYNLFAGHLQRDVSGYYRYFSDEIVERLAEGCENQIFVADNPAFSSSLVRAQSLRNTVLQALENTGADKVIIVGMSQGSQDARLLTKLPVSNVIRADNSSVGNNVGNSVGNNVMGHNEAVMADKIAALVTIVGENEGSWSASVFLNGVYAQRHLSSHWRWQDYQHNLIWQLGKSQLMAGLWKNDKDDFILSENHPKVQSEADIYQQFLASNLVLTRKYMTGQAYSWVNWEQSWDELRQAAGVDERMWPLELAASKLLTIPHYSYASQVNGWKKEWGQSRFIAGLVEMLEGKHDGYATVESQVLSNQHVKTMSGSAQGNGYHHMFFSGRNDELYGPKYGRQELGLYGGSSADFYEQVMRDLVEAGF